MSLKFITAEEAASFVKDGDNVGFSGFTPAGAPKVISLAIAEKAIAEHAKGNPFMIEYLPEHPQETLLTEHLPVLTP